MRPNRPIWRAALTAARFFLLALLPSPTAAQESGWIRGRVVSSEGDLLAGASVRAGAAGTIADGRGEFVLGPLPARSYEVRAALFGWREASVDVRVNAG